jgi:hypothetical protein
MNVHVLDGNFLLALPSIALQCLGLGREGSQGLLRMVFPTQIAALTTKITPFPRLA